MKDLDTDAVEKFIVAFGGLMTLRKRQPSPKPRLTVMFSYGPPGFVDELLLARTTAELDVDVIHLEFEPGREAEGPVNIYLCEDRNGTILTWPKCELWTDRGSFFLVVPHGKDFGFAFDGSALIRVTDIHTGPAFDENVEHARELLASAAARVPAGVPRVTQAEPAPYLSRGRRGMH
ncbi:MAG: hypothetical protein K2W81_00950 [Sphingomonas sp.]|uniref:hypothetical protein n=1 Tax=Sphingomonas sp. TaxID=28214 RepID=UPI0025F3F948|nr:hypothetical protein [Sphingomonas sp.]MBY0282510.1 hypothetical protein [Sphingomonas sp.]